MIGHGKFEPHIEKRCLKTEKMRIFLKIVNYTNQDTENKINQHKLDYVK